MPLCVALRAFVHANDVLSGYGPQKFPLVPYRVSLVFHAAYNETGTLSKATLPPCCRRLSSAASP